MPRLLSISRDGRFVAVLRSEGLLLVDSIGVAPARLLSADPVADFSFVGAAIWAVRGRKLRRWRLDGQPITPSVKLPVEVDRIDATRDETGQTALLTGESRLIAHEQLDSFTCDDVGELVATGDFTAPVFGRRLLVADGAIVRVVQGTREIGRCHLDEEDQRVIAAAELFEGRAITLLARGGGGDTVMILHPSGLKMFRVHVPRVQSLAIAERRGVAIVLADGGQLVSIDLRAGRIEAVALAPAGVTEVAVDQDAHHIAMAASDPPVLTHQPFMQVFGASPSAPPEAPPYAVPEEHLEELLDLAAARAGQAISGSPEHVRALHARIGPRTAGSVALGMRLPFAQVCAELGLDAAASNILLTIAAPALRDEIAHLYRTVAADANREVCDRALIEKILAGVDPSARAEVARALVPEAPLMRTGVVRASQHPPGPYTALTIDPAWIARLRVEDGKLPR